MKWFEMSYLNCFDAKSFPKFASTEQQLKATYGLYNSKLSFNNTPLP